MHFLQAINSDISVPIVCNKTGGGTIKRRYKKNSKQGTSDARPRSAKIINASSYETGLEKRGGHNYIGKKLKYPKSPCEKHSKKHMEYSKRGSSPRKK